MASSKYFAFGRTKTIKLFMNNQGKIKSTLWQKIIALVAVINLLLVFLNISYLPFRDVYLRYAPILVKVYDPVKGVEPHPETETYLAQVQNFKQNLAQAGLQGNSTQESLRALQEKSITLISENPFLASNKLGTFAKLKR